MLEISPLGDVDFRLFQRRIYEESGIFLAAAKKDLLVARLNRRLRTLGIASYASYLQLVQRDSGENRRMLERICTHETRFFRESRQFEFLSRRIVPHWNAAKESRRVRVWSTGCSTGEEPYSIAMTLLDRLPGWSIEVLASDLSDAALEKARRAVWPIEHGNDIPRPYLERFMLQGTGSRRGYMAAGHELRSVVRFCRLNLNADEPWSHEPFDSIFCRNVLIYFNTESRGRAIGRILQHLDPKGYLFLGHAESLSGLSVRTRTVAPTIYAFEENSPWSNERAAA